MPEGDTIHHLALRLKAALAGQTVSEVRSAIVLSSASGGAAEASFIGATVLDVEARGKHLLVHFSSGFTLVSHLLMRGRLFLRSRSAGPLRLAGRDRLALRTPHHDLSFATQVVRLVRTDRLRLDPGLARVGPDPLKPDYDPSVAFARLEAAGDWPLGVALLDQRRLAGLGNVLKSEALFLAGADPLAPVSTYGAAALATIVDTAERVLRLTAIERPYGGRRTTRATDASVRDRGSRVWVYGRSGEPCFVCGALVTMVYQGAARRSTYHCTTCQPPRASPEEPLRAPATGKLGKIAPSAVVPQAWPIRDPRRVSKR